MQKMFDNIDFIEHNKLCYEQIKITINFIHRIILERRFLLSRSSASFDR